jgi:hypothetical protein
MVKEGHLLDLYKPFTFWKYIFHEWCHKNKLPTISYKLMSQIYDKITNKSKVSITCNDKIQMILNETYIIIALKI